MVSIIIFLVVCFLHLYKIDEIGNGLYVDESSIGLNAALISRTLRDEHGKFLPFYFRAFGDYRAPIYVYTVAIIYKIAGVSVLNLRLTSFLFFLISYFTSSLLIWKLFKKNKIVLLYFLISFGLLPQYFTLSRVSFEVISQLAVFSLFLLTFYLLFSLREHKNLLAILSSFLLGSSIYTYNTSKIMAPLFFVVSLIFFFREFSEKKKVLAVFVMGFLISITPFILMLIYKPDIAIDRRFVMFTGAKNNNISLAQRVEKFGSNYLKTLHPQYLAFRGDPNPRHHAPYGGLVFKGVYVLFLVGVFTSLIKWRSHKWILYFLVLFFISLISGPITNAPYHSLRGFMAGLFLTLISAQGFHFLILRLSSRFRIFFIIIMTVAIVTEAGYYQYNYFVNFPKVSIYAFESSGFVEAFNKAKEIKPEKLILSDRVNQPYGHYKFYDQITNLDKDMKVKVGNVQAYPGSCILYIPENTSLLNRKSEGHVYQDYYENDWYYRLRCFES